MQEQALGPLAVVRLLAVGGPGQTGKTRQSYHGAAATQQT
jgi:hypothetical protein